ncbi:co-chaperone HscB [Echinimonas agarilytica]|uniref:Co-chaperone protein HscB homolog n=1 Tax=Echinimonas agarilytica TaxID=1215918 RepID=A0AA41W7G8_9GAMM|nr:co-chaperone HscB [Echinimonas agarilytica]MCM2680146.1 co-chaperone HscB [Echinimonas agarilytica]
MQNHFELFGLPVAFTIDMAALNHTYRELQKNAHPDRFAGEGEQAQRIAVQKSAQINDAFQTLKAELPRAQYMLQLIGVELRGEQTTMRDTEFLMQQMEWRETLEDLRHAKDLDGLEDFSDTITAARKIQMNQIAVAFDAGEHQRSPEHWTNQVRKLAFMVKLSNEIAQAEEALDD